MKRQNESQSGGSREYQTYSQPTVVKTPPPPVKPKE